jgi:hypothetical protein
MPDTGMYVYGFTYGANFELNIIYDQNGGVYSAGTLIVTIYDNSATGSYTWPEDGRWVSFNLSGLTQPEGTVIAEEVIDMTSPYDMVSVTLNNVGDTAYDNLYEQIHTLLNYNPLSNRFLETVYQKTGGKQSCLEKLPILISVCPQSRLLCGQTLHFFAYRLQKCLFKVVCP